MKKLFFIIGIGIVLFAVLLCAELPFRGKKQGLTFSNVTGDLDLDGRTGFHLGAVAELGISDKFSIQPEIDLFFTGS